MRRGGGGWWPMRWGTACCIRGNHLWMQDHPLRGHRVEREAEEFAGALLVDEN